MMKNQLAGLMKQAQQMQDNMKKMQDELALVEVEGQSGAGLVKVTMTCKHDVRRVAIDPRYFRPTEVETLLGDASKAREKLGWTAEVSFPDLVADMVASDLDHAKRDALVSSEGYKVYHHHE